MRILLSMLIASCILLQGCSAHPAFDDSGYTQRLDAVVDSIKNNPSYKRVPIDTDEQVEQFTELTYQLYKKQISNDQFVQQMLLEYPDYQTSIRWLATQFQK
ncbi:hypothetical protein [Ferrimonas kyonanensis]|uniref:hypothetical protein n=1 Tax=Ferrimonas kyonanensis TaxID=364763 RepID=UPI00040EFB18|nr:hypothetical protein [Ferrimonas kyonanensis]